MAATAMVLVVMAWKFGKALVLMRVIPSVYAL
jgi:hypothetical protein